MVRCLAHTIGPVVEDLDVSPCARRSGRRHCADDHWLCWVCHVNEAGAFAKTNEGIFVLSGRISPPPNVVPTLRVEVAQRHMREQIHILARISSGLAPGARDLGSVIISKWPPTVGDILVCQLPSPGTMDFIGSFILLDVTPQ